MAVSVGSSALGNFSSVPSRGIGAMLELEEGRVVAAREARLEPGGRDPGTRIRARPRHLWAPQRRQRKAPTVLTGSHAISPSPI